jgi:uncharacterized protein DUF3330
MTEHAFADIQITLVHVTCTVCQHEIPASEAIVPEAVDYLLYFCGLECFEHWRSLGDGR